MKSIYRIQKLLRCRDFKPVLASCCSENAYFVSKGPSCIMKFWHYSLILYVYISQSIIVFNSKSIAAKLSGFLNEKGKKQLQGLGRYICIVYLKVSSFHAQFYIDFLKICWFLEGPSAVVGNS